MTWRGNLQHQLKRNIMWRGDAAWRYQLYETAGVWRGKSDGGVVTHWQHF